jgi:hypothetical protein
MKMAVLILAGMFFVGCRDHHESSSVEEAGQSLWIETREVDWNEIQFGGEGSAQWSDGVLHLEAGVELTGTQFSGELPEMPYELELEACREAGSDFFCGLTFPVSSKEECLTFIVGGWGGGTVGVSSIDGMDASENETTTYGNFKEGQWYAIRLVVEKGKLSAFIDGKQVVDVTTEGRKLGLRPGVIEYCAPMGIAAWQTEAKVRNIRWRSLAD